MIHMHMPSHQDNLPFIPIMQDTITNQLNTHPNHTHILCKDINQDIALVGRQNGKELTPPPPLPPS